MKNSTILLVDDEQRMRTLLKDFLVKKDYEVIEALMDSFFSSWATHT